MSEEIMRAGDSPLETPSPTAVDVRATVVRRENIVAKMDLLWNRRRFVTRLTGLGLLLALIAAFLLPKEFESTATLMPPDQTGSSLALLAAAAGARTGSGISSSLGGSGLGGVAGDLLGMKSSGDLFVGILQSRSVEDDLVNKFDLRKVYRDRYMNDARVDLAHFTDVAEDRKSGIISIKVTDRNPQRAAAMAQEYVDQLNAVISRVNTTSAHRERVFLEDRLVQVKQDLENAEKTFSVFASKNTAIDIPEQGKAMIEASAALEGQLIVAQTELQGMKQIYTDNNVRVRSIQARVNELQHQLQQFSGKADGAPGPEDGSVQGLYPSIRQLPLLGVSYADLYRNTRLQESIFEALTAEYELAKVEEAKETPSVKVIDPPDVPEKKSSPHRLWISLAGAFLFFAAGNLWILGQDRWEHVDSRDPGKLFARHVFATLRASSPLERDSENGGIGRFLRAKAAPPESHNGKEPHL